MVLLWLYYFNSHQMADFKAFRQANKFTQKECADYFDVSQAFISQVELGNRPIPDTFITKIKADNSLTGLHHLKEKDEQEVNNSAFDLADRLARIIENQQDTIKTLSETIKNLTDK